MTRPRMKASTCSSISKRSAQASGSSAIAQSISPFGPSMNPSSETCRAAMIFLMPTPGMVRTVTESSSRLAIASKGSLGGIRAPGGAVAAGPAVLPRGREVGPFRRHAHAKSQAAALLEQGAYLLLGRQVIRRHELDRGPREDALAPVSALAEQHLAEGDRPVR